MAGHPRKSGRRTEAALSLRLVTSPRFGLAGTVAFLLASAAHADPRDLDAHALDEVTAGKGDEDPSPASVVVADRSRIDVHTLEQITLEDASQEQASALNLTNAGGADIVNVVNVASVSHAPDAVRVASIRQVNDVLQIENSFGRVERISLAGPNLDRSYQESRASGFSTGSRSMQGNRLWSHSSHSVVDTYNAGVPAYYPLQDLTITLGTPDLPAVTVPAFGFDLTYSDDVGTYGIRGGLGPFTFDPPQIVLGTVSFQGDDLVVAGGYVDLPSLDLGTASLTLCVVTCGSVTANLPTVDGPRIDLPGEWRFEGANPFKDVRINAGNGIAAAGSGHITLDAAHVTLGAELSLDLPDLTTEFSFNVLGDTVSTGRFGVEIPAISASVTLVDADIGPGFSAQFDGALCLAVQTNDCGTLEHSESSQSSSVDIRFATASVANSMYEERNSSGQEYVTPGATLTGAEAELIAMSEGKAKIEQASVIDLGGQAQRGMAAVNAVNATGAMVGNAVNVSTQRSGAATSTGLAQSNVFTQFKTRPRGP